MEEARTRVCPRCAFERAVTSFQMIHGGFRGPCLECRRADAIDRFWAKVQKVDGCWTWSGYVNPQTGYGSLSMLGERGLTAHRVSWRLHIGDVPDGQCVCHRCDNRVCVRPDHLFLGSVAENNQDMWGKGRGVAPRGEQVWTAKLSPEVVQAVRAARDTDRVSYRKLGQLFGISARNAEQICKRRIWRNVA